MTLASAALIESAAAAKTAAASRERMHRPERLPKAVAREDEEILLAAGTYLVNSKAVAHELRGATTSKVTLQVCILPPSPMLSDLTSGSEMPVQARAHDVIDHGNVLTGRQCRIEQEVLRAEVDIEIFRFERHPVVRHRRAREDGPLETAAHRPSGHGVGHRGAERARQARGAGHAGERTTAAHEGQELIIGAEFEAEPAA